MHFRLLSAGRPLTSQEFLSGWITTAIWLIAIAPLAFAAWEIGRQHAAGRRFETSWFIGVRMVIRLALSDDLPPQMLADFDRPARDDPKKALAFGAFTTVAVPLFFASFAPPLRTPAALAWLVGAGVLMGLTVYGHRRAAAYLIEEPPSPWDLFRQFRLLNPERYHPAGRKFVRLQIVASTILPFWWLGIGALLLFRQQHN